MSPQLLRRLILALCFTTSAVSATAQPLPSNRVYVRFGSAVRVPGTTLEPGEYLFALGTPVAGQAMIDIYSGRDSTLIVSCLGVETRVARPSEVMILEYPGSTPPALRAWFHPGNAFGFEFVYGAVEAKAVHLASGHSVPFASLVQIRRDMLGTFAISLSGGQAAESPQPVGTTGTLSQPAQSLTALQHLEAARDAVATQLQSVDNDTRGRLAVLVDLFERLEHAYRAGSTRDVPRELALTTNTLGSILPLSSSTVRLSGVPPMGIETIAALERARAHLIAFASLFEKSIRARSASGGQLASSSQAGR